MRTAAPLTLILLLTPAIAWAECAPSARSGTSANKKWEATPTLDGTLTLSEWNATKKQFEKKHAAKFEAFGHHLQTFVADDGRFVLWDEYAGIAAFDASCKLLKQLGPEELLTKEELAKRPGKWPCHGEGKWAKEGSSVVFGEKTFKITLYTDKTLELDWNESWAKPGVCETPNMVKAHGMMNCVAQEWTCARCKKKQDGLVWDVCPTCCKELSICFVCRKSAKK